jgi:hypothetical protein
MSNLPDIIFNGDTKLKRILLALLVWMAFLLAVYPCQAQKDKEFLLVKTIQADIADFTVDNLGNIYLLSPENQLKKLSPEGDSLAVFNEVRRYGKIYSMDVTNPLKILLYYKEFETIVVVDRFLNIINTIDLRNLNIFQAKAIGLAYDNNVWVYDELEAKLKRIGDDGSLIDQTTDIRQIVDSVPDPIVIIDQSGLVYLYDTTKGVYVFDHYGAFKNHLPLTGWEDFTVIEKNILGRNHQFFFRYQLGDIDVQQEPIPSAYLPSPKIDIMPSSIYVLKQKGLEIYSRR